MSEDRPIPEREPRHKVGRIALATAILATLTVVLAVYLVRPATTDQSVGHDGEETIAAERVLVGRSAPTNPDEPVRATGGKLPDHRTLAPSLKGTDVDGHLAADENGNLILVLGVRDFFDYFLSTVGEIPLEQAVAYMEAYARERLPEKAVAQLMALLDNYMAYRQAAAELYRQPLVPGAEQTPAYYLETLDRTFRDLRELRREHMSDDAVHAFFSLEEEYGQYTLDRMAIEIDPTLARDERLALLEELRGDLQSELLRESEDRNVARAERARELDSIIAADTDIATKRSRLAEHHPPETVERIVEHLENKSDFQARMDEYLIAREPLMALPVVEREARLEQLRQRFFHSEQEIIWARTYEARAQK